MDARKESIEKLSKLVQICKDGYRGLWQAAGEVENESHKQLLRARAFQRMAFLADLEEWVSDFGAEVKKDGTLSGKLHRGWMNLRHSLNPHEDKVVLLECQRGEEYALKVYQDIFDKKMLLELQPALEEQFVSLVETRDILRDETEGQTEPASQLHLRQ